MQRAIRKSAHVIRQSTRIYLFQFVWSLSDLSNLTCVMHTGSPFFAMSSEADADRLHWAHRFALRSIHKATLESLLRARNHAVQQLLEECNDLLHEQ